MTEQYKATLKLALIFTVLIAANFASPFISKYLSPEEQTILFLVIVYSGGAIYAFQTRDQMNAFIKNWPSSLVYTAFILYACKIAAEKVINARTGIEVENIRYASTIGGALYSVPLSMIVISFFMQVKTFVRWLKAQSNGDDGAALVPSLLRLCFITSLFGLGMYTFPKAHAVVDYAVLADATSVNSCGPAEPSVVYVRKNSETCKRIHISPFEGIYESTDIPSKSG
ncbi:hypothetical protein F8N49_23265 [Pseudomonas sp. GXM4]|uniref:hypothetical protein n=1 Tax=Pseudomonas sp. GXM4 TaxID=2651867 RepID=UPI00124CD80C|nr:hypothetical protein [Pseudomonas sp. GXM4]KAB2518037.1 hypothetical protein F8N49_23265 [Pseudomonas sp. GXM4]